MVKTFENMTQNNPSVTDGYPTIDVDANDTAAAAAGNVGSDNNTGNVGIVGEVIQPFPPLAANHSQNNEMAPPSRDGRIQQGREPPRQPESSTSYQRRTAGPPPAVSRTMLRSSSQTAGPRPGRSLSMMAVDRQRPVRQASAAASSQARVPARRSLDFSQHPHHRSLSSSSSYVQHHQQHDRLPRQASRQAVVVARRRSTMSATA